jgi:hypothetical protein
MPTGAPGITLSERRFREFEVNTYFMHRKHGEKVNKSIHVKLQCMIFF